MTTLDILLRGAAIGAIGVNLAVALWHDPRARQAHAIAALGMCIAGYLLASAPWSREMPEVLWYLAVIGATLAPLALTWAATEVFLDHVRAGLPWLALAGLGTVFAAAAHLWPPAAVLRGVTMLALFIGLIWLAVSTGADDLVERRRRFRHWFVALMGALGVIITSAELSGVDRDLPPWAFIAQAIALWAIAILYSLWALEPRRDAALPVLRQPQPEGRDPLTGKLDAAMSQELWRQEGLTIGALAAQLKLPEHRLRRCINQNLGHRNFSSFINGHRIAAAKADLRDPEKAERTILQIAYETGFASLGPFNKAFRAQTGQSPREYRAEGPASAAIVKNTG